MYQKVLVPVDGSETSRTALREAIKLAKEQGAKMRLVYVCEPMGHYFTEGPLDLTAAIRREGEQVLGDALAEARKAGVDAATALVESGGRRVAAVIVEDAGTAGADLIAMGTHGRRAVEHLVLGSVAEGVARRAAVPVLLIRGR
ncbi:MAG: universal stress protein [Betaproteobacteria bacterium]|nr:universal stress protein [Betaproteobacteria bacterium]